MHFVLSTCVPLPSPHRVSLNFMEHQYERSMDKTVDNIFGDKKLFVPLDNLHSGCNGECAL